MASSLIRINEATPAELQTLHGIGPKRASNIENYRSEVAPIRTTFDLATAAGISLKTAEQLSTSIDWYAEENRSANIWPPLVCVVACIWLALTTIDSAATFDLSTVPGWFNLSLVLIMLGALTATLDITLAAIRGLSRETTLVFPLAGLLCAGGFTILTVLVVSAGFVTYPEPFQGRLFATLNFLVFTLAMVWLVYGPTFGFRWSTREEENLAGIRRQEKAYHLSMPCIAILGILALLLNNSELWIEEVFMAWCAILLASNTLEIARNRSAFEAMLSEADQSRLRFVRGKARST